MQRGQGHARRPDEMMAADARGEHTPADPDQSMERTGDTFPEHLQNLEELVDSPTNRMAAVELLLRSRSDE